jgi:hypothetical protein
LYTLIVYTQQDANFKNSYPHIKIPEVTHAPASNLGILDLLPTMLRSLVVLFSPPCFLRQAILLFQTLLNLLFTVNPLVYTVRQEALEGSRETKKLNVPCRPTVQSTDVQTLSPVGSVLSVGSSLRALDKWTFTYLRRFLGLSRASTTLKYSAGADPPGIRTSLRMFNI